MACKITLEDGLGGLIEIENIPEQGLAYELLEGGGSIQRMLDGSAVRQHFWAKERITLSGRDVVPAGLRGGLDYAETITLTVDTGLGTDVYSVLSLGPSEDWDLPGKRATWQLVMEEV